jgi:hypothetical protein
MDIVVLSAVGFLLSVILIFLVIRNLEACIFWSALLAPAVGGGLVGAITHAIAGNYTEAFDSIKLLPFFIASIDSGFFTVEASDLYFYVGLGFLLVWFYILSHYAVKKFGMWALPILPVIVWGVGLTLPNLRARLMTAYPQFAFLFDFYGIPILIIACLAFFGVCYLIWRRGYSIQHIPFPKELVTRK